MSNESSEQQAHSIMWEMSFTNKNKFSYAIKPTTLVQSIEFSDMYHYYNNH